MKYSAFAMRFFAVSLLSGLFMVAPAMATEGGVSPTRQAEPVPDAGPSAPTQITEGAPSVPTAAPAPVEVKKEAQSETNSKPKIRPKRRTVTKRKLRRKAKRAKKRAKRKRSRRARQFKRQRWPNRRPKVAQLGIPKLGPAPYGPGERLLFQVKMFGSVAGEAILAIGQPTKYKGRNAVPLVGFIRSGEFLNKFYPVNDRMVVLVEESTLQPLKTDFYVKENKKVVDYHNTYDQRGRLIRSKRKKSGKVLDRNFTTVAPIYEPLGSVYGARRMDLKVGDSFSYYAWDGRKERLISVKAVAEERVWTQAGWFDTIKLVVDSQITGGFIRKNMLDRPVRRATVWIGRDRWRTPVKMISPTKLGDAEVSFVRRYHEDPKTVSQ